MIQAFKEMIDVCVSILMLPIDLGDGFVINLASVLVGVGIISILMYFFHGIFD